MHSSDQDTLTGLADSFGNVNWFVIHTQVGGQDTVTNFQQGTDFLRISTAEFGGIDGVSIGARLLNNTAAASGSGNPELLFDNLTGTLRYDADGTAGGEIVIAILTGQTANLTTGDFDVVA